MVIGQRSGPTALALALGLLFAVAPVRAQEATFGRVEPPKPAAAKPTQPAAKAVARPAPKPAADPTTRKAQATPADLAPPPRRLAAAPRRGGLRQ